METFWRLFEKSTVTTFIITIGVVGAGVYCWVTQDEVPDALQTAVMLILGYFFGVKGQIELKNHKASLSTSPDAS